MQGEKKQIEEIANDINKHCCSLAEQFCGETSCNACLTMFLYNAGYRKQSEGEWSKFEVNGKNYGQVYYQHKECPVNETQLFPSPYNFCPNCGAKMKGV